MRYALEHTNTRVRFCPEVGTVVGFPTPEDAMRHIFEVLPNDAHNWQWVPIQQPATNTQEQA